MSRNIKLALASSVMALGLLSFTPAMACPGHDKEAKAAETAPATVAATTAAFRVDGMHCSGCADHIKESLAKAPGILNVDVKTADHRVVVKFDSKKITAEKIAKLISDAGYPASAEV